MKLTRIAICLFLALALSACYDRPAEVEQALVQAKSASAPKRAQPKRTRSAAKKPSKKPTERPAPPAEQNAATQQAEVQGTEGAPMGEAAREAEKSPTDGVAKANGGTASGEPAEKATAPEEETADLAPPQDADEPSDNHVAKEEPASEPQETSDTASEEPPAEVDWASYITVDELRQEINFMLEQMLAKIATRRDFDRYYRELQGDASVLGVLGVILQEHPDAGKLKRVGAAIAEASIDLAISTDERSAASYADTKEILERVRQALTSGSASADVEPVEWEDVADLVALMNRMDVAYRRLRAVVNSPTFAKDAYEIAHEAKLLAILAKVSSYYRDNEPGYVRFAGMLEQAALKAGQASLEKNVDVARKAVSDIGRVCNECHRAFRLERATGNSLDF